MSRNLLSHNKSEFLSITFNLSIVLFSLTLTDQHRPALLSTDVINPTSLAPQTAYIYRLSPSEYLRSSISISVSVKRLPKLDKGLLHCY
jgi:hypothetical protein